MRPVRYHVAASLDGRIAGPAGEFDWIPTDPDVDSAALFARADTVLLGRHSWTLVRRQPERPWPPGTRVFVFSRTLTPADAPDATLVRDDAAAIVAALRHEPGDGEIWRFGGGALFASLLAAGQVDRVEVTVAPVLLGDGVPLLPPGVAGRTPLALRDVRRYPRSGMVTLTYDVGGAPSA